jgi:hypothetical protein
MSRGVFRCAGCDSCVSLQDKQTVGRRVSRRCVGVGVPDAGQDLQPCLLPARLCCGTVAQFLSGRHLPGDSCIGAD